MNGNTVFLVNLLATWYMVGLIWMVQIVHYNLMDRVGPEQFVRYETDHGRLITPIVAIPMLVEILSAAGLVLLSPAGFPRWAAWIGLALVVAIWMSTAFLQIPYHNQLLKGFSDAAYRGLVGTNWIRTILWTVRGLMMGWFARTMLSG
ncbi:hypothetical protein LF1_12380 [Rubripirellula obstinata]|uniref:DUF1772 domain-containing protein n=1 Tax=Rubripirellula obstinata TaxID=406547 RepID=A0A5B1CFM5_9BACT|nr:hypothetical protein [Rubripirellula obstinata]KAA1258715.1 hypothetical protein LF1_12380 [Rubripirellula obstinata]